MLGFTNISVKLRFLARLFSWIGITASCFGLFDFITFFRLFGGALAFVALPFGICLLIAAFPLFALGQISEDVQQIRFTLANAEIVSENEIVTTELEEATGAHPRENISNDWICAHCGEKNAYGKIQCMSCGNYK